MYQVALIYKNRNKEKIIIIKFSWSIAINPIITWLFKIF